MEYLIGAVLLVALIIFRKSIGAWASVAESKSVDTARRQEVESYKYRSKTVSKIDELDDIYDDSDIAKLIKARRKETMKTKASE